MDDSKSIEISVKDLFQLYLSKLWLIGIAVVIGTGSAFGFTKLFVPLKYSSHISMYVQSYTGVSNGNENYNDISKSKQLINTYVQVLKDDAVMESIAESLLNEFDESIIYENFSMKDGEITSTSLKSVISITTVEDTSAVNISATTQNAELSAAICNELCRQANNFTTKAIGVGEIKSIDTAKVYPDPVSPNILKNTVIGAVVAFFIAAVLIFLVYILDNTVKSAESLSREYEKAVVGEINEISEPNNKKNDSNINEYITLLNKDVPFQIVESYKSMRTNIMFTLSTMDKKIFTISSANPGEGKSTTAANIAITFSQNGQKVLLIDADMRKPIQHKIFSIKNHIGLSSVLSKMKKVQECIQKTEVKNLSILPSGPIPPNPSELLASDQAETILSELSYKYDLIIIDTPPINMVSDALNLSQSVAGILTVVRYGCTAADDLKNAVGRIELAKMELLGFILNYIKTKHDGTYYSHYKKYGYGYEYGYGKSEKKNDDD